MAVIGKVLIAAVAAGTLNVALDRDTITAINTLLNFASWWLLIRQQRNLRNEVTPKLEHVEDTVTTVLETRMPGGQRKHDPPTHPDEYHGTSDAHSPTREQ